jgi:transposase
MAQARRTGRRPGKSDPIDAEAVAIAALRHPDLPVAELDDRPGWLGCFPITGGIWSGSAPASPSQVRWHGHELDPDLVVPGKGLDSQCVVDELRATLGRYDGVVARLAVSLLGRCPGAERAGQRTGP